MAEAIIVDGPAPAPEIVPNNDHDNRDPETEALSIVDALVIESLNPETTATRNITILHELATLLENLEIEYSETSGNRFGTFDEDMRDNYRIGLVIDALNNHDAFMDHVIGRLAGTQRNTTLEQAKLQAATYRLMMACSVGPNGTAVAYAAEESVVDLLIELIFESASPPVRCYATGFLSVALLERRVADRVVRRGVPSRLLQNLVRSKIVTHGHFPADFGHPDAPLSQSLPERLFIEYGETVRSIASQDVMRLECSWTLQCLASMGDYQETLGPATSTGVLDIIIGILGSAHDSLHLDAIELAWHMLAHKRFASAFVRAGGVQLLLRLSDRNPRDNPIHGCITLCFSGLASLSSVMEQTCQLGQRIIERMVDHALRLTVSVRELHRRNAGLFLSVALPFPTLLRHFDVDNRGLAALIHLLESPLRGLGTNASTRRQRSVSFSRGRSTSSSGSGNRTAITADDVTISTRGSRPPVPSSSSSSSSSSTTTTTSFSSSSSSTSFSSSSSLSSSSSFSPSASSPSTPFDPSSSADNISNAHEAGETYRPYRGSTMPERHIGHSCVLAIRQLFRSHLALVTNIMRRRIISRQRRQKETGSSTQRSSGRPARPRLDSWSTGSTAQVLPHRALEVDDASTAKNIALIETYWQIAIPILQDAGWKPVHGLLRFRGLHALIHVVAATNRFGARNNHLLESSRYALDVLSIVTFLPKVCQQLSDIEVTTDGRGATGMTVLLVASAGTAHHDPNITILALQVLCHMVTPRHVSLTGFLSRELKGIGAEDQARRIGSSRHADRSQEKVQKLLRVAARANDGIAVCLSLLEYKGSPNSADAIRHFAARFLLGLAQDRSVAQILDKLNVSALLKRLWKAGPVVQVNKRHHKRFCDFASVLIKRLAGASRISRTGLEARLVSYADSDVTQKAATALFRTARSDARAFHMEMHRIVHDYLRSQGLERSAIALADEAGISSAGIVNVQHGPSRTKTSNVFPLYLQNWPAKKIKHTVMRSRWRRPRRIGAMAGNATPASRSARFRSARSPTRTQIDRLVSNGKTTRVASGKRSRDAQESVYVDSSTKAAGGTSSHKRRKTNSAIPDALIDFDAKFSASISSPVSQGPLSSVPCTATSQTSRKPIKLLLRRTLSSNASPIVRLGSRDSLHASSLKRRESNPLLGASVAVSANSTFSLAVSSSSLSSSGTALVGLVQRGLTNRGGVPALSREEPEDRKSQAQPQRSTGHSMTPDGTTASEDYHKNFARNLRMRQVFGARTTISAQSSARSFGVFSHFRQMRTYRSEIGDVMYSSASFLGALNNMPRHLLVTGQENGIVGLRNMWTCEPVLTIEAHNAQVENVDAAPCADQRLLLTASSDGNAKIWDTTRLVNRHTLREHASFDECFNPQFSHSGTLLVSSQIIHDPDSLGAMHIGQRYRTTVHDIETKTITNVLEDHSSAIMYRSGCCCFDSLDHLVFCDGQAWDLRSNSVAMRFDRLGNEGLAVFHPRRSELIIDSAVWDMRLPSRLLKVVDALAESRAKFSVLGDALYTYKMNAQDMANRPAAQVVRVLDGWHHRDIGQPIELEAHYARDLCVDRNDDYIAITIDTHLPTESCVKLFEVGRKKPNEADSDMDDAQTDSEDEDEDDDEFGIGFGDGDQYYNAGDAIVLDEEPDLHDWLFDLNE